MGRPAASRPTSRQDIPDLRARVVAHVRSEISKYHDPESAQYLALGRFKRDQPPRPELAKRRVVRLTELAERIEAGDPFRIQRFTFPPDVRPLLPAGGPADWYIVDGETVVTEDRRSDR